ARYRGPMASPMAPPALDPALTPTAPRPANHAFDHSRARPHDDHRESVVGSAADPRRIGKAGHHRLGADRVAAPASTTPSAVTDVADVSHQSCRDARVHGLLHRAHHTGRVLFVVVLLITYCQRSIHVSNTEHPTA